MTKHFIDIATTFRRVAAEHMPDSLGRVAVDIATMFRRVAAEHMPDSPGRVAVDTLAEDIADTLAQCNPRFDRSRFLAACRAVD